MKVRHRAALAMAAIIGGIVGSAWGLWISSIPLLTGSLVTFVIGFVYGHRLVYSLPERPDTESSEVGE